MRGNAATEKHRVPTTPTIKIQSNAVDIDPGQIWAGDTVTFENHDSVSYQIRFWVHKKKDHPHLNILLPGKSGSIPGKLTVSVDADAGHQNGNCVYEWFEFPLKKGNRPRTGGGGKIIVGNGPFE